MLVAGETLSSFIQQSVERAVEHRRVQAAFNARAEAALDHYKRTGVSHSVDEVVARLQAKLDRKRYRRSGAGALRRELIISFGETGYVAQYEIEPALLRVIVLAVRHQREDDYH